MVIGLRDHPSGFNRVDDPAKFARSRDTPRIDGHGYASVEHYFPGSKARCSDRPQRAQWFR